jgi:hypothetical protein
MEKTRRIKCGIDEAVGAICALQGGGNVCVAYTDDAAEYANALVRKLARAGFVITERCFSVFCKDTPDYIAPIDAVRLIIGIGDAPFAGAVAASARIKRIKAVFFTVTPCLPLYGKTVYFFDGGFNEYLPSRFEMIVADESLTRKAGEKVRAGALGMLLARAIGLFDGVFCGLTEKGILSDGEFKDVLKALSGGGSVEYYGEAELDASVGSSLYSAVIYNKINPEIEVGEAAFIISYTLIKLYARFLQSEIPDLTLPKDYNLWSERLARVCGADTVKSLKAAGMSGITDYLKKRHITGEYRQELLSLVNALDAALPGLLKKFRRAYGDAGFFIKDKVKGNDILESIALGAALGKEYTLAKHMDEAGVLDFFTATAAGGDKA